MNFSDVASLLRTAELSMSEKGIASAKVILTGFVVVFVVLILLILIIKIYGAIITNVQQGGKSKKEKARTVKTEKSVPAPAVVKSAPSVPKIEDGISEETVAVIAAAAATMYGSPEKVRIKSIKKSDVGRSAWANAGVINNTRPF